ncbi:histone-lysine N-methyltransferase E(z)-like isoform X2 [Bradysia coprophila]|uniref:histone-lysine N-methyltransferase E(z)-like isoform X2 n=1 Tax=Bradysia coprophila TaxID=38358 RepID=UPI00187D8761|nr:histone-lysine N-methyltransferase E(z)-like isoform X2 [Bradysia coprophila]
MDWKLVVRSEYRRLQQERQIQISNVWKENRLLLQNSTDATSGRCHWRVQNSDPLQLSKGPRIGANFFVKKQPNLQVIWKHLLPVVDRPPQNITWLPIPRNIPMKTLQSKTYVPFLGNEAVDSGLVDELMNLTECDSDDEAKSIMEDELFVNLVEALIQIRQRHTGIVTSLVVPDPIIFQRMCEYFTGLNNADYLCEKYEKLTKRAPCRPNIDEPMKDGLCRNAALTSFYKLFCRKCCIYSCPFHCHENNEFIPKPKTGDVAWLKPFDRPCSNLCYMVENSGHENREEQSSSEDGEASKWSGSELTMLTALVTVFPNNFCAIAEIIRSKSCKEVHRQFKLANNVKPIRTKKSKVINRGWRTQDIEKVYKPCNHEGLCTDSENCACINCEKFCNCAADCKYRTRMTCNCKKFCATQSCLCIKLFRECDPDTCTCVSCQNVNLQRNLDKKMHVASSDIHGWGLFVDEDCQKGDYITEYKGEIISTEEADRRAKLYTKENSTYMFTLNEEFVVDAMNYGGKFRFANFSRDPNCRSKILRVNGDHRIGIYAQRFIKAGEELTLDYLTIDPTLNQ